MRVIHIGIFSNTLKDIQKNIYYHLELCDNIEKIINGDFDVVIFDASVSGTQLKEMLYLLYDVHNRYDIQTFYENKDESLKTYPIICKKDLCKPENFTYYMSLAISETIRIEVFSYISLYLLKKGYSMYLSGFKYLQYAGYLMYFNSGGLKMKDIYSKCAEYYKSSETGVEKAIRDSIRFANKNKSKVKNSEMIKELKEMLDKEKIGRKEKIW